MNCLIQASLNSLVNIGVLHDECPVKFKVTTNAFGKGLAWFTAANGAKSMSAQVQESVGFCHNYIYPTSSFSTFLQFLTVNCSVHAWCKISLITYISVVWYRYDLKYLKISKSISRRENRPVFSIWCSRLTLFNLQMLNILKWNRILWKRF